MCRRVVLWVSSSPARRGLSGSQRPRIESRPEAVGTYGPKVTAFAAACGVQLDDWQSYVIDGLFAVTEEGQWASTEFGLLVSRQNGKGEILVAYDLAHLFLFPRSDGRRKTILHTAHEMKTAIDGFERLKSVIESQPQLMRMVAERGIYTANGREGIVLKPRKGQKLGDRIRFVARSKNSGRGFSGDVIVQDEAQEESQAAHNALTYTQSAVPNRQELFTGTVPEEGVNDSEVFEGVRDRGRSGTASSTGWMEWTPEGSDDPELAPGIDKADPGVWAQANPAAPHRIQWDTIQDQHDRDTTPGRDAFGRERLSIWPNRDEAAEQSNSDVDMDRWYEFEVSTWLSRRVALAVSIGRGGGYSSICGAQRLDDGRILVQHLATNAGTLWLAGRLKELRSELSARLVVLDEKNAATVTSDLTRAGVRYIGMHMSEVAAAFDMTIEYINGGVVAHPPQPELDDALAAAVPRVMNKPQNLKTWDQGDPMVPSSAVQAMSLAIWGLKKTESRTSSSSTAVPAVLSSSEGAARSDDVLTMRF